MKELLNSKTFLELVKVYQDLERTLQQLKRANWRSSSLGNIDVKKLIAQLSRSKRRIERKIGNTILLETEQLKTRLKNVTDNIKSRL